MIARWRKNQLGVGTHEDVFLLRSEQEVRCLRSSAEGVPRRLLGAIHTRPVPFPRPGDGARRRKSDQFARLSRIDVLVIDDWAMAPLSELERRDF